ncbi:hypothetical protein PG989_016570 [Apiospora arundinis]
MRIEAHKAFRRHINLGLAKQTIPLSRGGLRLAVVWTSNSKVLPRQRTSTPSSETMLSLKRGVKYQTNITQAESRNRLEIVEWLKKLSRLNSHTKKRNLEDDAEALPNTGNWIFNDHRFFKWLDGDTYRLWCFGKPGVGKTVLATKIIRYLEKVVDRRCMADDKPRGVLYVYFDYQERENQTPAAILADLLAQLLCLKRHVSEDMARKYNEWRESNEMLTTQGYLRLLMSEAASFHRLYLVLDGLDEYFDETKENRQQTLMGIISQLPRDFKVLVMSRNHSDISKSIQFDDRISIQATNEDLTVFMQWRISNSGVLKQAIEAKAHDGDGSSSRPYGELVAKSRGNFLLAQLQMDAFEGRIGPGAIDDFQGDLSDFYEVALKRILTQQKPDKGKALAALSWVCYAARPLSIEELSQAVTGYKATDTIDGPTMEAICAGLILIERSGSARLLHYTAHEFLEQKGIVHSQRSHLSLAQKCLRVLQERPRMDETAEIQCPSQQHPQYLSYAADNWGYHLRRASKESAAWTLATEFLEDETTMSETTGYMESIPWHLKTNITALHLSTFFGSKALVLYCIDDLRIPIDAGAEIAHAAAHWALIFKKPRILEVLLQKGADINAQDSADEGYSWAVKLLVPFCINLCAEDKDGFSALRLAVRKGHQRVIRTLVEGGADINVPSTRDGWLILNQAASYGKDKLVRFLIPKGADLHRPDRDGFTSLQLSVQYGHTETAYTLLRAGADRSVKDKHGNTLLHNYIENWSNIHDNSLFWILVECGCSLEERNAYGMTPLESAITRNNMSAAWLLIHKGANLSAKNRQGQTPLHTAVACNQLPIVNLLLDQGASHEALNDEGRSPMHTAASLNYIPEMTAFLCRGKGLHVRNKSGLTPLHTAAMLNRLPATDFLLQNGADPDLGDKSDRTPLYLAIVEKALETAAVLIKATRQLDKTDHEQQTYLHVAAFSGEFDLVQTLLEAGVPIDQQDARGRTPLHAAIIASDPNIACLLVLKGASVDLVDSDGCSALHHAAVLGDEDLIPTLTKTGDKQLQNNGGKTPKEVAGLAGHRQMPWE